MAGARQLVSVGAPTRRHGRGATLRASTTPTIHAAYYHERCQFVGVSRCEQLANWRRNLHQGVCRGAALSPEEIDRESHKIFDEVVISVRAGDGGKGEITQQGRGKWVANFKYSPGGNLPKKIWLPASMPADGADGADVVLCCDAAVESLLHLHQRKEWRAKKGSMADPVKGSGAAKAPKRARLKMAPLEVRVPPGTLVRRKKGGPPLGELLQPGQRLVVAHGGRGGVGVVMPSRQKKNRHRPVRQRKVDGVETIDVGERDQGWREDARGLPGEELNVHLQLRVVADLGLVGFPNAGKSSLLAKLTQAHPKVAPYPFTTLMPNLGVMQAGGDAELAIGGKRATLADLPGLIEGAHQGKGLGRVFLRHLSRTRALLHIVDASAPDPATDYYAVREELRMYNPEYCTRPHIVLLNKLIEFCFKVVAEASGCWQKGWAAVKRQHKPQLDECKEQGQVIVLQEKQPEMMDLVENAASRKQELQEGILDCVARQAEELGQLAQVPWAFVGTSAADGSGIDGVHEAVRDLLSDMDGCSRSRTAAAEQDDYSWASEADMLDWQTGGGLAEEDPRFPGF